MDSTVNLNLSVPAESRSIADPDLPAWDLVGRFLARHEQEVRDMARFYHATGLSRFWVCEVRGISTNVLFFQYLRHTGSYADNDAVLELLTVINQMCKTDGFNIHFWTRRYLADRLCLVGQTTYGFYIWIQTNIARNEPIPTWIP